MKFVGSLDELHQHYGEPGDTSLRKVAGRMTKEYRAWIFRSRFCVLTTVGPEGTDATPRGDDGPVVLELDEHTLAMPDWRGNDRIDSLRNIVRDPRSSLMFFVPGSNNVVRINGKARVTVDADMRQRFERKGKLPRSVVIFQIEEIYSQCARALIRSALWSGKDQSEGLPTVGQILAALTDGDVGGAPYDDTWAERAAKTMW